MKDNIAIIGLMEEYNKAVSSLLCDKLNMYFLSLTDLIAYQNSSSIPLIISDYGYEYYFNLEKQSIRGLNKYENTLLFCTAASSVNKENLLKLKEDFTLILINASETVTKKDILNNLNLINRDDFIYNFNKYRNLLRNDFTDLFDIVIDVTRTSPNRAAVRIMDELLNIFENELRN